MEVLRLQKYILPAYIIVSDRNCKYVNLTALCKPLQQQYLFAALNAGVGRRARSHSSRILYLR
jgi:hypothetical protein